MGNHDIRLEITGELALAGFFLMSHWSNPNTCPELETSDGLLKLVIDTRGSALNELRETLANVEASDPALLQSANAWLREIARLLASAAGGGSGTR